MKVLVAIAAVAILVVGLFFLKKENMPPNYDDPYNIVINGESMTAAEYVDKFCRGVNEKYRGTQLCQSATTAKAARTFKDNPNSRFHGATFD